MALALGFTAKQVLDEGIIDLDPINTIKNWLTSTEFPTLSDEQIILFLVSCDHDIEFTQETIKVYYKIRSSSPELFTNRRVSGDGIQSALRAGNIAVMPERYQNYAILIVGLKNGDYRRYSLKAHFKIACMTLDRIIYDDPPQGIISIFDAKLSSIMHITKMNVGLAKTFIEYTQYGSPLQTIQSHFLNTNGLLNTIINLTKPFMNSELSSKLAFHSESEDFDNFHQKCVPKRYLPKEYGGDLDSISIYHQKTLQKLNDLQEYFVTEEQQRSKFSK
ncbi:hypothetical protein RI129_012766 [Pyrocoelia pectoralis]|uniref:CRAL-TRIO domain-containing protein n=1 Tax=Pyrocoelia pectoralis TaxID=417401 RepID=A0AAN7V3I1_9COLE